MPRGIYIRVKKRVNTPEYKEKMSLIAKKRGYGKWSKGRKLTLEQARNPNRSHAGERHWNWKGGITSITKKRRNLIEYKEWRRKVFIRDEFTCKSCGAKNIYIQAHHIKPVSKNPEYIYDIDNGLTLCVPCHEKTDTYKGRCL